MATLPELTKSRQVAATLQAVAEFLGWSGITKGEAMVLTAIQHIEAQDKRILELTAKLAHGEMEER